MLCSDLASVCAIGVKFREGNRYVFEERMLFF